MKTLLQAATAVAVVTTANLSAAMANRFGPFVGITLTIRNSRCRSQALTLNSHPSVVTAAEGSSRRWRVIMSTGENCSKVGCFLEAALPVIAPAVALIWMLSLVAWS